MSLDARIGRFSLRGRCKCPAGTRKVFVGDSGVRCGKVKRVSGGGRRWAFVKTPASCNYEGAARASRKRRQQRVCRTAKGRFKKCPAPFGRRRREPTSHELTMRAARGFWSR
jgi:hypothetical protein